MNRVRTSCSLAAAAWVGVHLTQAVVLREQHERPVLLAVAVIVCVVSSIWACLPLWRGPDSTLGRDEPVWLLALAPPLTAALVAPWLTASGITGYANWPPGAMGVVIAGLVVRRHAWLAAGSAGGLILVGSVALGTTIPSDSDTGVANVLLLAVPPQLWLFGSLGVRHLLQRSARLADGFETRSGSTFSEQQLHDELERLNRARQAELERVALPVLRCAEAGAIDDDVRSQAATVAMNLRDGIHGRLLVDQRIQEALRRARARGVDVSVASEPGTEDEHTLLVRHARALLGTVLDHTGAGRITCRMTLDPPSVTLVLRSGEGSETVPMLPEMPQFPTELVLHSHVDEETVVLTLSPRT